MWTQASDCCLCFVEVDTSFCFCGSGHKLLIVVYVLWKWTQASDCCLCLLFMFCGSGHKLLIVVYVLWKWTLASDCCICFVEVDTSF